MPKIPFDASKVRTTPYADAIRKAFVDRYGKIYESKVTGIPMDPTTKAALDSLMKPKERPGYEGRSRRTVPPVSDWDARDKEAIKPFGDTFESAYERYKPRETSALEREALREAERMRGIREEAKHKERIESAMRLEAERQEREAKANQPASFIADDLVKHEVAAISVNSAKACIVINMQLSKQLYTFLLERFKVDKLRFDAKLGVWEAHPSIMPELRSVLKSHFKDIQVLGVPKAIPSTKFDQLVAKLDKDDRQKIYKLLALKYHTDRGGSHETMVLINQVFKES